MTDPIKNKILVIDDHPFFGMDLKYKFEKHDYEVQSSTDGKTGIEKAKIFLPDLILVDYIMPEMDGIEVCRQIKKIPELSKTILILYTSEAYPHVIKGAIQAGAKDFIIKTAPFEKIFEKVENALKGKAKNVS